jgi:hypothetical protein
MTGGESPRGRLIGDEDFLSNFGEDPSTTFDIDTWDTGFDVQGAVARLQAEIASAVGQEERVRATIRYEILPRLGKRPGMPHDAGVWRAELDELVTVCEGLLFRGRVEAVDGTCVSYESLPIGISQMGIVAVGYGGTSGTFSQRLFRKEMSSQGTDSFHEAKEFIDRRQNRYGLSHQEQWTELARRGIRTYAERRVLVDKSDAEWRIGRGNPCAQELLTGSGYMSLLEASLDVLQRLILRHKKFVFVISGLRDRGLLTIGQALNAGEYAILDTLENASARVVEGWRYDGGRYEQKATSFVRTCCPNVLRGLFRASEHSPPYLFYAHQEHVHMAARVALADSILRPERGFPMLLDVANVTCRAAFGAEGFFGLVHDAYTGAGANPRHFNERSTRG